MEPPFGSVLRAFICSSTFLTSASVSLASTGFQLSCSIGKSDSPGLSAKKSHISRKVKGKGSTIQANKVKQDNSQVKQDEVGLA